MSKKKKVRKIAFVGNIKPRIDPQEPPKGPEKPVEPPPKVDVDQAKITEISQNAAKVDNIFKEIEALQAESVPGPGDKEKKNYIKPLMLQYQMLNSVLVKIDKRLEFTPIEMTLLTESANELLIVYGLDIIKTMTLIAFAMSHITIIGFRIPLAIKFLKEKRQKQPAEAKT